MQEAVLTRKTASPVDLHPFAGIIQVKFDGYNSQAAEAATP